MEINLLKKLPQKTKKKPLNLRSKVSLYDKTLSWRLDKEYFDGLRSQGYGGYKYDGRWKPIAEDFIDHYKLSSDAKI